MACYAEGAVAEAEITRPLVRYHSSYIVVFSSSPNILSSRNVINVLLFVAQVARRYFPGSEAQEMLETFLPIVTKEVSASYTCLLLRAIAEKICLQTVLTMIPVMSCFLPLTHTHVYLPALFKLWEAFNSAIVNDWFLELCGDLSEEHVSGKAGDAGEEGGAEFKDVGMWSEEQWSLLASKTLGSMSEYQPFLSIVS